MGETPALNYIYLVSQVSVEPGRHPQRTRIRDSEASRKATAIRPKYETPRLTFNPYYDEKVLLFAVAHGDRRSVQKISLLILIKSDLRSRR